MKILQDCMTHASEDARERWSNTVQYKLKYLIYLQLGMLYMISINQSFSQNQLDWVKQIGSSNYDKINNVLYSNDGLYIYGYFSGSLDIDPGTGITMLYNEGEAVSSFVAKFDTLGNFVWVKQLKDTHVGDYGGPFINDLIQNNEGNILMTGYFEDSTYFDFGNSDFCLYPEGEPAGFLWILDSNGNFLDAMKFDGQGYCNPDKLITDNSNNILITGSFRNEIDFDPGLGVAKLYAPEFTHNVFICKLDSSYKFIWVKQLENSSMDASDEGSTLATDYQNNVYIGGTFHGKADFDPGIDSYILYGDYDGDGFIWTLDSSGNFIDAKKIGGVGAAFITKILVTSDSSLICSGIYKGTCCFDNSGAHCLQTVYNEYNSFICNMEFDGTISWLKEIKVEADNMIGIYVFDIIKKNEDYYIAGIFDNLTDFDPGPDEYLLQSNGWWDLFIGKYDSAFNLFWINRFGGSEYDSFISVQVDNKDHVYCAGSFRSTLDFDPDTGVNNLTSYGVDDGFLLKLTESQETAINSYEYIQPFHIVPNPAQNFLMVNFQNQNQSILQFVDITGRKVEEISILPSETSKAVNCSHWPPGIYLGQLISDGKIVAKGKVVVR